MAKASDAHVLVGRAVRQLRNEQDISQEELASRSRVHRTYVWKVESGRVNLTVDNLQQLAEGLGLPMSRILVRAEALTG